MRDIPVFCTDLGVASLVLKMIPYTKEAYIHLQDAENMVMFLKECCDFCVAAGAEHVYATGDKCLLQYPNHTTIVRMQCGKDALPESDASLFPVQEETVNTWREIYNEKMRAVPNASYISKNDARKYLKSGNLYFIHKNGSLLGIGSISGNNIDAIASVVPGEGTTILLALCGAVMDSTVTLSVANNNAPAMTLYERLGFLTVGEVERWYKII